MDGKILRQLHLTVPVLLRDEPGIKAPLLKILPHPQGTDNVLHLRLQGHDRGIVQMIPVVMGNGQHIKLRHIIRSVDIAAGKSLIDEKQGGRIGRKHRVNKYLPASQLQEKGGMAHPDHRIAVRSKLPQIRPAAEHGLRRGKGRLVPEKEFCRGHQAILAAFLIHDLHRHQILELAVHIMGRSLHAGQPRPPGRAAKLRPVYKQRRAAGQHAHCADTS